MSKQDAVRYTLAALIGIPSTFWFVSLTSWQAAIAVLLMLWANNIGLFSSLAGSENLSTPPSRDAIIEECARVLDDIVVSMEEHTNQDGMVTGRDFYHPEIVYIEDAAKCIRFLKTPKEPTDDK